MIKYNSGGALKTHLRKIIYIKIQKIIKFLGISFQFTDYRVQ